jgi:hypothetical protein
MVKILVRNVFLEGISGLNRLTSALGKDAVALGVDLVPIHDQRLAFEADTYQGHEPEGMDGS